MGTHNERGQSLAANITRASSKQTFFTFRLLADRERIEDAYRAYGYFRWVDDILDTPDGSSDEKLRFIKRQKKLLETSYRGESLQILTPEEKLLGELIQSDTDDHPGLRSYLHNMMAVMEFDVKRRGSVISQTELDHYTRHLAVAVMDALLYFIGHDQPPPDHDARYHAVTAAHITHMLRDTYEDVENGYYNISREYLQEQEISPHQWDPDAYREWAKKRVQLARSQFKSGREYISQIKNFRCRLAGFAYTARFEIILKMIERDNYILRKDYHQRKSVWSAVQLFWSTMISMLAAPFTIFEFNNIAEQPIRIEK